MIYHRVFRSLVTCICVVVLLGVPGNAFATSPAFDLPDIAWKDLDSAYCSFIATGRLAGFIEALLLHSGSGDRWREQRVTQWLGYYNGRFTLQQNDRIYEAALASLSDSVNLSRARDQLRFVRLANLPLSERRRIYEEAIANAGGTSSGRVSDRKAMALGAREGIEAVREPLHREEMRETQQNTPSAFQSARFDLLLLRLRSGALDRDDALRMHLEALLAMPVSEVQNLLLTDSVFRGTVLETATDACTRSRGQHCSLVGKLCQRWRPLCDPPAGGSPSSPDLKIAFDKLTRLFDESLLWR